MILKSFFKIPLFNHLSNPKIIVSLSNGKIGICQFNDSSVEIVSLWKGHVYETWIANFDSFHPDLVFSGADDCFFKGWDMRKPLNQSIFQINYDAGVTSIQPNPYTENQIAVGRFKIFFFFKNLFFKKVMMTHYQFGI